HLHGGCRSAPRLVPVDRRAARQGGRLRHPRCRQPVRDESRRKPEQRRGFADRSPAGDSRLGRFGPMSVPPDGGHRYNRTEPNAPMPTVSQTADVPPPVLDREQREGVAPDPARTGTSITGPIRIGNRLLPTRYFLAPLAGYTH